MTCDIVIKTYPGDFPWLVYALRSIHKFGTGFRQVHLIVPHGTNPPAGALEHVHHVHERGDGYMFQQSMKLHADAFSNADYIMFNDSDTIFTRPFSPADFIVNDKPVWLYTPRSSMGKNADVWRLETEKTIGRGVEHEFMRRHPFIVPRWAFSAFRDFCWKLHGVSLEHFIMSLNGRNFSEWNAMGAYLWYHHHERVHWVNTDIDLGVPFVKQKYSWGGLTDEIRAELEEVLK